LSRAFTQRPILLATGRRLSSKIRDVDVCGELLELASALVRVESINPSLWQDGSGEGSAASLVAEWGRARGLEVEIDEAMPGRPNVIVTAHGRSGGPVLLLNGHLDTVGVAGMQRPFEAAVRDGRLHGRGAYDMKGAVAAALVAAALAREERVAADVVVACVIDEEYGSAGTERLADTRRADAAIVCEPTEELVCVAHRGFAGFEIEMPGRAAHGSRPDLGVDAIAAMGPVLARLGDLDARLGREPGHVLLGPGSVHASLIEGGQEYSSYPARCLLTGERRTIPGEMSADVELELAELVGGTAAEARLTLGRGPFELSADHPFAALVEGASGGNGFHGVPFWTDAALLAAAGIPTVLYGPVGGGAHAAEEWVELESLERCCEVYLAVARALASPG
jgi:acetylornithine deacetylase